MPLQIPAFYSQLLIVPNNGGGKSRTDNPEPWSKQRQKKHGTKQT
jgi:hypothetical protein